MLATVSDPISEYMDAQRLIFSDLSIKNLALCHCGEKLKSNGAGGEFRKNGTRDIRLVCVDTQCRKSISVTGLLKSLQKNDFAVQSLSQLQKILDNCPEVDEETRLKLAEKAAARKAKAPKRFKRTIPSPTESDSQDELSSLRLENAELREVIREQGTILEKLNKLFTFDKNGNPSLRNQKAIEPSGEPNEDPNNEKESDVQPAKNEKESDVQPVSYASALSTQIRRPRKRWDQYWSDLAKKDVNELSDAELNRVLNLGREPKENRVFHKLHIQCRGKAGSLIERKAQMSAFLKATGLKQIISTFSIITNILEIYVTQDNMPKAIEIINNHKLVIIRNFDCTDFGEDEEKVTRKKNGLIRRVGHLLARNDNANLRDFILKDFPTDLRDNMMTEEDYIRERAGRSVPYKNGSSRTFHRFTPVRLEDFIRLEEVFSDNESDSENENADPTTSVEVGQPI